MKKLSHLKLREIEKHFRNLSDEQFEENLLKAGINEIEPSGMDIMNNFEKLKSLFSKNK